MKRADEDLEIGGDHSRSLLFAWMLASAAYALSAFKSPEFFFTSGSHRAGSQGYSVGHRFDTKTVNSMRILLKNHIFLFCKALTRYLPLTSFNIIQP